MLSANKRIQDDNSRRIGQRRDAFKGTKEVQAEIMQVQDGVQEEQIDTSKRLRVKEFEAKK